MDHGKPEKKWVTVWGPYTVIQGLKRDPEGQAIKNGHDNVRAPKGFLEQSIDHLLTPHRAPTADTLAHGGDGGPKGGGGHTQCKYKDHFEAKQARMGIFRTLGIMRY